MCEFCKLDIGTPTCDCECQIEQGEKFCSECQHELLSSPSKV